MQYFAYGSNMDWNEMREVCRHAEFLFRADLSNHELVFPRRSVRRRCGVAGIVRNSGRHVWGVVYNIPDQEVSSLDRKENYGEGRPEHENSYNRKEIVVLREGDDQAPVTVQTYFAVPQPSPPLPSRAYKAIIVGAARYWKLPPEYIVELEKIVATA